MKKIICMLLSAILAAFTPQTYTQTEEPVYAVKQETAETVTEVAAEPLKAEVITEPEEPIHAESVTESSAEDAIEKEDTLRSDNKSAQKEDAAADPEGEPAKPEDEFVIDNSEIESCDHVYTRIHGTGGEEGDVWEYSCDKCGDVYFEPYGGSEGCVEPEEHDGMEEYDLPEE